jgi:transcriptional regulator with XRE-family HTH domain
MIKLFCNYWHLSAAELGRCLGLSAPQEYISGEKILPVHIFRKVSQISSLAEKFENKELCAVDALREHLGGGETTLSNVVKETQVSRDTIKRWLRGEAKPGRSSLVKVAALIVESDPMDDLLYQIEIFVATTRALGISARAAAKLVGLSAPTLTAWASGMIRPDKENCAILLPWLKKYNSTSEELVSLLKTQDLPEAVVKRGRRSGEWKKGSRRLMVK